MHITSSAAFLMLGCAMGLAAPAAAQADLHTAVGLYTAAAYEDALVALDGLSASDATLAERTSADHVRMLCLLALGRTAEAEATIVSLLHRHPTYRLNDGDAAPRVLLVFADVRRRTLPEVTRRRYQEAKRLYESRQFEQAATAFAVVRGLVDDPDLAVNPDPALTDLSQLADGFAELNRAALEGEERRAALSTPAVVPDTPAPGGEAQAGAPVPPRDPASAIFDARDRGVVPPVIVRQDISRWLGARPTPRPGTNLGSIEVIIDESGAVMSSTIRASVSRFYDTVLLESARVWRYQPATSQGQPVKYRRIIAIVAGN